MKFELLTSRFFLPFSVTRSDISYLDGRYIVVVSTPFSPTVIPGDREVSGFNYCASKSTKLTIKNDRTFFNALSAN